MISQQQVNCSAVPARYDKYEVNCAQYAVSPSIPGRIISSYFSLAVNRYTPYHPLMRFFVLRISLIIVSQ